jgi:FKBP-type peptidyl-prolyl cis-trans isomerase
VIVVESGAAEGDLRSGSGALERLAGGERYPQRAASISCGVSALRLGACVAAVLALVLGCEGRAADASRPESVSADLREPDDAERLEAGLSSKVLRAGEGAPPRAFDRVKFHYRARDEHGRSIASSRARGGPVALRMHEVTQGWAPALRAMRPREQRRVWIASERVEEALRPSGGGALVVDLELLAVLPGDEPLPAPPDLLAPPAGAERTPSGLVHALLAAADRPVRRAELHDRVRVVYAGFSADGRMIDGSQARGSYAELLVSQGFPGFREALTVLREGERRRFWIPEELAYGNYPGGVAGPLVFDIELLAVIDRPSPPRAPDDVGRPPGDASRTRSGIAYRVLARGQGTRMPGPTSAVEVHYSYWSSDGRLIDSTVPNGVPQRAELKYHDLPPGLAEAVQQMVVGERRLLWIPEDLASSGPVKPAPGTLVYDLELLAIYEGKRRVDAVDP